MAERNEDANGRRVAELIRVVPPETETVLEVVKDLEAGGSRLVVQSRRLQPEEPKAKVRAESPRRAHRFADVNGFAAYVKKAGTEQMVVLADSESRVIAAVLDDTAPRGFETVTCAPALEPCVAEIMGLCGLKRPEGPSPNHAVALETLIRWVMKNRTRIDDGRELALMLSQVTARSEVTLQRGRGNKSINGLVVATQVQGQPSSTMVELPDELTVTTPLFVGWPAAELTLSLLLAVAGNEIVAVVDCLDLEEKLQEAFLECTERLGNELGGRAVVSLGRVDTREWAYL